ncbi:unnamed protein product [Durusdinium trenchii]|uniref:DUF4336 domain-containing protein n=1 Tax=Durusdinium trenchii TaxID=1381693 RepID=A0ABP0L3A9_9DINO
MTLDVPLGLASASRQCVAAEAREVPRVYLWSSESLSLSSASRRNRRFGQVSWTIPAMGFLLRSSRRRKEPRVLRRCKGHGRRSMMGAALALSAGTEAKAAEEGDYVYPEWLTLPLAPYARRRTLLKEIVPNEVWTLDQIFGTFYVYVPIRATVLKVKDGLLVYAPVAATKECLSMIKDLEKKHGPVRWILLPSKAVEHKVLAGPFAKKFPKAKLFVAPGQFSVPVDLPLNVLGFPSYEVLDPEGLESLPWAEDCQTAYVDASTFGEVALLHKSSKTLVVTDSVISIPEDPPELLLDPEYRRALAYHAREAAQNELPDTVEVRRKGWARIALFATFFNPGALSDGKVEVPEAGGSTNPF